MRESYNLTKSLFPKNLISKHWDIYPSNFWEVLFDNEKIKYFRSNELNFKWLPFDKKWMFELSQPSFFQPLIHEGLLPRMNTENITLKRVLSKLKPYDIEFFKILI